MKLAGASGTGSRPRWIGWALHAFMAFILFNGTVVFESGIVRWAGLTVSAILAAMWLNSIRGQHRPGRPTAGKEQASEPMAVRGETERRGQRSW